MWKSSRRCASVSFCVSLTLITFVVCRDATTPVLVLLPLKEFYVYILHVHRTFLTWYFSSVYITVTFVSHSCVCRELHSVWFHFCCSVPVKNYSHMIPKPLVSVLDCIHTAGLVGHFCIFAEILKAGSGFAPQPLDLEVYSRPPRAGSQRYQCTCLCVTLTIPFSPLTGSTCLFPPLFTCHHSPPPTWHRVVSLSLWV